MASVVRFRLLVALALFLTRRRDTTVRGWQQQQQRSAASCITTAKKKKKTQRHHRWWTMTTTTHQGRSGVGDDKTTRLWLRLSQQPPSSSYPAKEISPPQDTSTNNEALNLLLIDHYDSFTYNLVDLITQACNGRAPVVLPADAASSWEEMLRLYQNSSSGGRSSLDGVILSPGPGAPHDWPVSMECVQALSSSSSSNTIPIFGVCLGHQILAESHGGTVASAPTPVHGQVCTVTQLQSTAAACRQSSLWKGLPETIAVTRYHSLAVRDLPPGSNLTTTAAAGDDGNICMALEHTTLPQFGVQFHPESIGTTPEHGRKLVENWLDVCRREQQRRPTTAQEPTRQEEVPNNVIARTGNIMAVQEMHLSSPRIFMTRVTGCARLQPQDVMEAWYADEPYSYWLDSNGPSHQGTSSSTQEEQDDAVRRRHRVSILGSSRKRIEYWSRQTNNRSRRKSGIYVYEQLTRPQAESSNRRAVPNGSTSQSPPLSEANEESQLVYCNHTQDIMSYLRDIHAVSTNGVTWVETEEATLDLETAPTMMLRENEEQSIPFSFRGGHVGYLGYEVRHDTIPQSNLSNETRNQSTDSSSPQGNNSKELPTAAFLWADRSLVYDHDTRDWYLVAVEEQEATTLEEQSPDPATAWIQGKAQQLRQLSHAVAERFEAGQSRSPPTLTSARRNGAAVNGHSAGPKSEKTLKNRFVNVPFLRASPSPLSSLRPHNERAEPPQGLFPKRRARRLVQQDTGIAFIPRRSRATYYQNFEECIDFIRQGLSYELCLTNQFEAVASFEDEHRRTPFDLYCVLRRRNPAPMAAFFNWNSRKQLYDDAGTPVAGEKAYYSAFAICCSSPERFVSVQPTRHHKPDSNNNAPASAKCPRRLVVEAKPIKGTCARVLPVNGHDAARAAILDEAEATQLQNCPKNRAENIMIVDLLRNDLSRVCLPGSVKVPKLCDIESFATVHQMVSTIRGILPQAPTCGGESPPNCVDVLASCFPGGSMTGAPKRKTVDLLDQLEGGHPRGPYSGCLGYLSLDGSMDMNIVIRSAMLVPTKDGESRNCCGYHLTVGAGGAITILSKASEEYDEMMLKAATVIQAVEEWAAPANGDERRPNEMDDMPNERPQLQPTNEVVNAQNALAENATQAAALNAK